MSKNDMAETANDKKIAAIADYVIANGTENTSGGNWITDFSDIPSDIATLDFIKDNAEEISDALAVRDEVLDIEMDGDSFDVVYGLAYCPNLENEEDVAMYEQAQAEKIIDQFWSIIDTAREESGDWKKMCFSLQNALSELNPPDIVRWQLVYDQYFSFADHEKIASAATYINNGISDDGFMDFRSWLIAQGKEVYMNTLAEPDSLANIEPIKTFFAEVNNSDYEPSNGYKHRPQFEQFAYAAAIAYEQLESTDVDFYVAVHEKPLPETIVNVLTSEIKYAKDIDAVHDRDKSWLQTLDNLGKMFPKLKAAKKLVKTAEKPSILETLKINAEKSRQQSTPKQDTKKSKEMEM